MAKFTHDGKRWFFVDFIHPIANREAFASKLDLAVMHNHLNQAWIQIKVRFAYPFFVQNVYTYLLI
ncbi:hypothetical protein [Rufibacter sp. LB8]|uniref:hypothetical protein n=1 Tax=Rufibacter sp. LB8 TaxID=2777781 RepID=UPI00178C5967|nr:hypothetical protein [Rufibacter sp. LB8]